MTPSALIRRCLFLALTAAQGAADVALALVVTSHAPEQSWLLLGGLAIGISLMTAKWARLIDLWPRGVLLYAAGISWVGSLTVAALPDWWIVGTLIAYLGSSGVYLTLTAVVAHEHHQVGRWRALQDAATMTGCLLALGWLIQTPALGPWAACGSTAIACVLICLAPLPAAHAPDRTSATPAPLLRAAAVLGAMLAVVIVPALDPSAPDGPSRGGDLVLGLFAGTMLAAVFSHPFRQRAALPLGLLLLAGVAWATVLGYTGGPTPLLAGLALGWAGSATLTALALDGPINSIGRRLCAGLRWTMLTAALVGAAIVIGSPPMIVEALGLTILALLVLVEFRRPLLEQLLEPPLTMMYRVRGLGPGLEEFPRHGPVVIVCNHTAWFDPFWVAKVVPRPIVPMMTSRFYDVPVVSWLMKYVVGTVRVQLADYRREAPELADAVAVLDRGGVLVVYPEGALKRSDDASLRRFGRGIWAILAERPETPVITCWIEGGWGSFTSYFQGPPTKNKRPDWRREIRLGFAAPQRLEAALLVDHQATRAHLRSEVMATRGELDLPPLPANAPAEEPAQAE